jgi:hypothetical protein
MYTASSNQLNVKNVIYVIYNYNKKVIADSSESNRSVIYLVNDLFDSAEERFAPVFNILMAEADSIGDDCLLFSLKKALKATGMPSEYEPRTTTIYNKQNIIPLNFNETCKMC